MQIIHLVLGKANPNRMNGVSKIVHNLVMSQNRLGYDVMLWGITPNTKADLSHKPYRARLFKASKLKLVPKALKNAIKCLSRNTIVHIHGAFVHEWYGIAKLLTKRRIPFTFTPHGPYNTQAMKKNWLVKTTYFKLFESKMLKMAASIHLSGKSELDSLQDMMDMDGMEVNIIPNGQNMKEMEFDFKPLKAENVLVFGFCGRLAAYHKGLDHLVDAYIFYRQEGGKAKLWLIGDGEDRNTLERKINKHRLENEVKFFGALFGQDKLNRIANMDVFFHTSRFEGMPTAVVEAAALGKPCVVTKRTNVEDYIQQYNAGIYVKENNAKEIAKAMHQLEELHSKGALGDMEKSALAMVEEKFNWERIAQKLVSLYPIDGQ